MQADAESRITGRAEFAGDTYEYDSDRFDIGDDIVIGPTPVFLGYIEKVLPSLGETGVVSTTMSTLLPGITATGTESDVVARIKGRRGWGAIIAAY